MNFENLQSHMNIDMPSHYESLRAIWDELYEKKPDDPFFFVSRRQETRVQKYTNRAFAKRAFRHGVVFQSTFKVVPGDTVAVCVDDLSDFALLVHGALLAHCIVIPVAHTVTLAELEQILKATAPKIFIFPPALSATVSALFANTPSVEHWVVTGKSRYDSGLFPGRSQQIIKRLESALLSTVREKLLDVPPEQSTVPCGVVFAAEGKFISAATSVFFSRKQILQKAWLAAMVVSECVEKGNVWTSAHEYSPLGFLFNFFVPLFIDSPVLVRPSVQERDFWPQMLADDIGLWVLRAAEVELLHRKGKSRGWRKPNTFAVLLSDEVRLDAAVLEQFTEGFHTPLGVAFVSFPLAEYVSCRKPQDTDFRYLRGESGEMIPGYGACIGKVDIAPSPLPGFREEDACRWGELVVESHFGGKPVRTGIRATQKAIEGREELYVAGPRDEILVRSGKLINLGRINTLIAQLQGVVYGRAFSYPDIECGENFSLYVMTHRLSEINKYDIDIFLAEYLPKAELPKAVVVEGREGVTPPETLSELRRRVGLLSANGNTR